MTKRRFFSLAKCSFVATTLVGSLFGLLFSFSSPVYAAGLADPQPIQYAAPAADASTPAPSKGQDCPTSFSMDGVLCVLNGVLGTVLNALGKILNIVIDIFLSFAQYNGFASAPPVNIGWKIIRDFVNMFFIVILLVSAFSTIIGYGGEDFHYRNVLPKLLGMAILINFSRTLIQLLIDFSQVIMLTFVNAFYAASAGNLADSFGLTAMTKLANETASAAATPVNYANIFMAYLLALVAILIAIGTMVILTIFILGRIIDLWVVLILSPLAFFMTALPGKIKNQVTSLTKDYWGKLSGALVGGPLAAFWLFVFFAISSSGAANGGGLQSTLSLYKSTCGAAGDCPTGFLSQFGQSPMLAKFAIAIVFLVMALKEATKSASSVADGAFAGLAQGVEGLTRRGAAKVSPVAVGAGAARAGYRGIASGARGIGNGINRRFNVSGRAAQVGQKIPLVRSSFRQPLAKMAAVGQAQREAESKALLAGYESMSVPQKQAFAQSLSVGRLSAPAERRAYADVLSDLGSQKIQAAEVKRLSAGYQDQFVASGFGLEEAKRKAAAKARVEVGQASAESLSKARVQYQELSSRYGDTTAAEKMRALDEQLEQNPYFASRTSKGAGVPSSFDQLMERVRSDPEKMKGLSAEALSRSDVLLGLLPPSAIKKDASGKIVGFDSAQVEAFMAQQGNTPAGKNLQAVINHVRGSGAVDPKDLNNLLVQKRANGQLGLYTAAGEYRGSKREEAAQAAFKAMMEAADHGRASPGLLAPSARSVAREGLEAGIPLSDLLAQGNQGAGGTSDHAMESAFAEALEEGMSRAQVSTTKADLDAHLASIVSLAPQLSAQGIDSDTQMRIIAGLRAKGAGAEAIAQKWSLMDRDQRKAMADIVSKAAARAEDVAKRRAEGATDAQLADHEKAMEQFMSELKDAMPQNSKKGIDPASGREVVVKERVPEALRNVLYG